MRKRWRKTCWKLARPGISAVMVLAYLAAAIGYPLPATQSTHPCGQSVCCCGSDACGSCGSRQPTARSCCPREDSSQTSAVAKTATDASVRWVVGIEALKCHGHATAWITVAAALPPALPVSSQPSRPFLHFVPFVEQHPFVAVHKPFVPPPRPVA